MRFTLCSFLCLCLCVMATILRATLGFWLQSSSALIKIIAHRSSIISSHTCKKYSVRSSRWISILLRPIHILQKYWGELQRESEPQDAKGQREVKTQKARRKETTRRCRRSTKSTTKAQARGAILATITFKMYITLFLIYLCIQAEAYLAKKLSLFGHLYFNITDVFWAKKRV